MDEAKHFLKNTSHGNVWIALLPVVGWIVFLILKTLEDG